MANGLSAVSTGSKYLYNNCNICKKSATYLLRAADYSLGIGAFDESIDILSILLTKYKGTYEYADALYFTGYVYDSQKRDFPKAKSFYKRFLKEHPHHDLAPQVEAQLKRIEAMLLETKK